jgi:hypothetical protein
MTDKQIINDYIHKNWKFTQTVPHPAQTNVLNGITNEYDDKTLFFISSGNSFGKTHLMCNIILNMCNPKEFRTFHIPLFDEYDRKKEAGEEVNLWIIGTADNFKPSGAIYSTLRDLDSTADINYYKKTITINGQHILFKTHEQDVTAFAGPRLFAIFSDEPMKEAIFHECLLRLTGINNANKMFLFFTPVTNRASYLLDYDESRKDEGFNDVCWMKGSIYDNPHATQKQLNAIERLVAINPAEKNARLYGEFAQLSGRIFTTFSRSEHVFNELPYNLYKYYISFDPHEMKSLFGLLIAVNPDRQFFVIDEFPNRPWNQITTDQMDITQQVQELHNMCHRNNIEFKDLSSIFADKIEIAQPRTQLHGKETLREKYAAAGVHINTTFSVLWDEGLEAIHEALYYDEIYYPNLHIKDNCNNLITAMERFSYKTTKISSLVTSKVSRLDPEWECPISALRFFVTSNFTVPAISSPYAPKFKKAYTRDRQSDKVTSRL